MTSTKENSKKIKCPYCGQEHEKIDPVNCKCGAYGHILLVSKTPDDWFWSRPPHKKESNEKQSEEEWLLDERYDDARW